MRDRLVHHAVYRELYPFFDTKFISNSFSCRKWKGTHLALSRFQSFVYKVTKNNIKTAWVLKCDIRKFFASIDQEILLTILKKYINDENIIELLGEIIKSFKTAKSGKGLPLGNLTSQLLVNIYMNEFDQFVKNTLHIKYYIRYADDFVVLDTSKVFLESLIPKISIFLEKELGLSLHPHKLTINTIASGIDFLGWVHFFDHRVLRTTTKKRMIKALKNNPSNETILSYRGLLQHGNTKKLIGMLDL